MLSKAVLQQQAKQHAAVNGEWQSSGTDSSLRWFRGCDFLLFLCLRLQALAVRAVNEEPVQLDRPLDVALNHVDVHICHEDAQPCVAELHHLTSRLNGSLFRPATRGKSEAVFGRALSFDVSQCGAVLL